MIGCPFSFSISENIFKISENSENNVLMFSTFSVFMRWHFCSFSHFLYFVFSTSSSQKYDEDLQPSLLCFAMVAWRSGGGRQSRRWCARVRCRDGGWRLRSEKHLTSKIELWRFVVRSELNDRTLSDRPPTLWRHCSTAWRTKTIAKKATSATVSDKPHCKLPWPFPQKMKEEMTFGGDYEVVLNIGYLFCTCELGSALCCGGLAWVLGIKSR